MLNERTTEYIINKVADEFNKQFITQQLKSLDAYLELAEDITPNIRKNLIKLATLPELDAKPLLRSLTDVEPALKILMQLVKPALYAQQPAPLYPGDHNNHSWTLGYLYHQAFTLIPAPYNSGSFNLTQASKSYQNYKHTGRFYYYLAAYFFRNDVTHATEDYNADQVSLMIKSYLIVMLEQCSAYHMELQSLLGHKKRVEKFDCAAYCQRIIDSYVRLTSGGFGYINTRWFDPKDENMQSQGVDALIKTSKSTKLKLTGEAGSGKTTALKRIEFELAKKAVKNSYCTVPIYVELCTLVSEHNLLLKQIALVLGLNEADVEDFLLNEHFTLLLDGFNEVLDKTLKRQLAFEIDKFEKNFPKVPIILTDRNLHGTGSFPILAHAKAMKLYPITLTDKENFFKKNCHDPEVLDILLTGISSDPEYFAELDTPLKLKELIGAVSLEHELPADIVASYLHSLIERERYEKKDENMNHMEELLAAFALTLDDTEDKALPRLHACARMNECKTKLGFDTPNVEKCLDLALGIGILTLDGRSIRFASEKYFEYFLDEANNDDMLDLFLS